MEDPIEEGLKLLEEKKPEEVLRLLDGIDLPEAYALRARAYLLSREEEKAVKELERGTERFPYSHMLYFEKALLFLAMDKLEEALEQVKRALEIMPYSYDYKKLEAEILFRQGKYEDAFNVLGDVIRLKPDDVEARLMRAECFYALGKYLDALYEINRALEYDNKNPYLHFLKGRVYLETRYYKLAESEFRIALSLKADPEFAVGLAVAEFLGGEREKALQEIEKAMKLFPDYKRAREVYETMLNQTGNISSK
ncbi:MAG: tetratricopeptide repeat protein [Candidatus Aramenus sulfurataquae]|jgi:tetratricopeptide (TPR) repeat protein|uniref:Tetratricopeptide repeat protein n=3 Tax=Candidatus Aramenus sulfurataquae TaxID=1326980 RepID=A0AAE3FM90_9CREN|nr:tetratricopeptide repeat protein [Candidatus Aramenus sulfurataquae]